MKLFRCLVLLLSVSFLTNIAFAGRGGADAPKSPTLLRVKHKTHPARRHHAHSAKHHRAHPART